MCTQYQVLLRTETVIVRIESLWALQFAQVSKLWSDFESTLSRGGVTVTAGSRVRNFKKLLF